jgi:uncharacterized phiE125 gp8 family phage protein
MHHKPPYNLVETSPPATEPLALDETKGFLRVDQDNDDALVSSLITAARQLCEGYTGRSLVSRGYSLFFDRWPKLRVIELPYPPLLSVAEVNIYAPDNSFITLDPAGYYADTAGGRIVLADGAVRPRPGRAANGIEIRYTAGYGAAGEDVPAPLRQGMLMLVAHLYEHRGDSPDQALPVSCAAALFRPYRLMGLS